MEKAAEGVPESAYEQIEIGARYDATTEAQGDETREQDDDQRRHPGRRAGRPGIHHPAGQPRVHPDPGGTDREQRGGVDHGDDAREHPVFQHGPRVTQGGRFDSPAAVAFAIWTK